MRTCCLKCNKFRLIVSTALVRFRPFSHWCLSKSLESSRKLSGGPLPTLSSDHVETCRPWFDAGPPLSILCSHHLLPLFRSHPNVPTVRSSAFRKIQACMIGDTSTWKRSLAPRPTLDRTSAYRFPVIHCNPNLVPWNIDNAVKMDPPCERSLLQVQLLYFYEHFSWLKVSVPSTFSIFLSVHI